MSNKPGSSNNTTANPWVGQCPDCRSTKTCPCYTYHNDLSSALRSVVDVYTKRCNNELFRALRRKPKDQLSHEELRKLVDEQGVRLARLEISYLQLQLAPNARPDRLMAHIYFLQRIPTVYGRLGDQEINMALEGLNEKLGKVPGTVNPEPFPHIPRSAHSMLKELNTTAQQ